jgi:hypothetical protein
MQSEKEYAERNLRKIQIVKAKECSVSKQSCIPMNSVRQEQKKLSL